MGARSQLNRITLQWTAALTLLIWLVALGYCSVLCCSPIPSEETVGYTHDGCQGHPDDANSDCAAFCNSIDTITLITGADIRFEKLPVISLLTLSTCPTLDLTSPAVLSRHPPDATSNLTPVLYLRAANQSLAPPSFC